MAIKRDNLFTDKYDRNQVVGNILVGSQFIIPTPANIFVLNSIPNNIEYEYRKFLQKVKEKNGE